jgi:hypothetical protein
MPGSRHGCYFHQHQDTIIKPGINDSGRILLQITYIGHHMDIKTYKIERFITYVTIINTCNMNALLYMYMYIIIVKTKNIKPK